jgi:hypothetical protein
MSFLCDGVVEEGVYKDAGLTWPPFPLERCSTREHKLVTQPYVAPASGGKGPFGVWRRFPVKNGTCARPAFTSARASRADARRRPDEPRFDGLCTTLGLTHTSRTGAARKPDRTRPPRLAAAADAPAPP